MIRYRLKKDLPDCKAGTILTKEDKPDGLYMYCGVLDGTDADSWYIKEVVENNPDWFELIKEEPKEVFTWDDEKVSEACLYVGEKIKTIEDIKSQIPPLVAAFKQSKTPSVQSKPDTSKEFYFVAKGMKMGYDYYVDETNQRLFTQQQMDKVREQTWEAARQTHPLVAGMRYLTLESYLQTIKK